ncbi:MAG: hypothetical protein AB7D34_01085 [Sulfurimonas sp.]
MRPLLKKEIDTFLDRFGRFVDSEFRSIEIVSPSTVKITLAAQDSARGFDWITVDLEFDGVSDANLPQSSKLPHLDMSDGVTLISKGDLFAFGVGSYDALSNITDSLCYIKAGSLKYSQGAF